MDCPHLGVRSQTHWSWTKTEVWCDSRTYVTQDILRLDVLHQSGVCNLLCRFEHAGGRPSWHQNGNPSQDLYWTATEDGRNLSKGRRAFVPRSSIKSSRTVATVWIHSGGSSPFPTRQNLSITAISEATHITAISEATQNEIVHQLYVGSLW